MKKLKLSFALIISILAIGVTVATKANFFGKRVITACFTQMQIKNAAGATFNLNSSVSCTIAQSEATLKPIVNSAVIGTALPSSNSCVPPGVIFCCVQVVEMTPTDPLYPSAPFINLGEGLRKYKIIAVLIFCKVQ